MQRNVLIGQRLVAAFLAGYVLFNYPVLALFDRPAEVGGIPVLFVYIFLVWAGLIGVLAWISEKRGE